MDQILKAKNRINFQVTGETWESFFLVFLTMTYVVFCSFTTICLQILKLRSCILRTWLIVWPFFHDRFCVTGPLIHYFYEALDKIIPRQVSYSKAKRLLVDRGLFSPLFLLLFFYVVAILEVRCLKHHEYSQFRSLGASEYTILALHVCHPCHECDRNKPTFKIIKVWVTLRLWW